MSALRNPRWEKFAQLRAERVPRRDAYMQAGFIPEPGNAKRLEQRQPVAKRIRELIDEAVSFTTVNRVRVVEELARIGLANVKDLYEPDGKTLKNISRLPRHLTAALAGLDFDTEGRLRAKLHDKTGALTTLLKHLGGLPDADMPTNVHNSLSILSLNLEDKRALSAALKALAASTGEADSGTPEARSEHSEV